MDDVVVQMQAVYDKLDPADKDAVRDAKAGLRNLRNTAADEEPWNGILEGLLTDEVNSSLGDDAAQELKGFLCDLADIQYSTDKSTLKESLQDFKTQHASTVRGPFWQRFHCR